MTSKGNEHNQGARPSYRQRGQVEGGLLNFVDQLMWKAINGQSSSHFHQDHRFDSESDILEQVNAYAKEDIDVLQEIDRYQSDEGKQEETLHSHQSSIDMGTSTSGTHFACANWVS